MRPLLITPKLAELPVYVRGGSILPIAPLTQSTDETPVGPLTLRVYVGENCRGDLYQDDGKSFAFRSGQFLRLHFSCEAKPDGSLIVHLSAREGSFIPWWKQVRVEAFGWTPQPGRLHLLRASTRWGSPATPGSQPFQSHPLL
jgi:alpha-glucosidase